MLKLLDERDVENNGCHDDRKSVMRTMLEDGCEFRWENGTTNSDFDDEGQLPLTYERQLGVVNGNVKSHHCFIYQWRAKPKLPFKHSFAVKELKLSTSRKSLNAAQQEINNTKELLHPHVIKLPGTYSLRSRLHILIYPAASCDLADFLQRVSDHLGNAPIPPDPRPPSDVDPKEFNAYRYRWPLRATLDSMLEALQAYYVCLCQAVGYLHESGLRHKDIKPENILIDFSGQVVLADFGISKKFDENTKSATKVDRIYTSRYKSPEIDRNDERDYPSDVFSLGCVFLEMATMILGKTWELCKAHCSHTINDTARNDNFCSNLSKVKEWINILDVERRKKEKESASSSLGMQSVLKTISEMLRFKPENRPSAVGLWKNFDIPGQVKCRDCHPDHPDRAWTPNPEQRHAIEVAKERRVSSTLPSIVEGDKNDVQRSRAERKRVATAAASSHVTRSTSPGSSFLSPGSNFIRDHEKVESNSPPSSPGYHHRFPSEPPSPARVSQLKEDHEKTRVLQPPPQAIAAPRSVPTSRSMTEIPAFITSSPVLDTKLWSDGNIRRSMPDFDNFNLLSTDQNQSLAPPYYEIFQKPTAGSKNPDLHRKRPKSLGNTSQSLEGPGPSIEGHGHTVRSAESSADLSKQEHRKVSRLQDEIAIRDFRHMAHEIPSEHPSRAPRPVRHDSIDERIRIRTATEDSQISMSSSDAELTTAAGQTEILGESLASHQSGESTDSKTSHFTRRGIEKTLRRRAHRISGSSRYSRSERSDGDAAESESTARTASPIPILNTSRRSSQNLQAFDVDVPTKLPVPGNAVEIGDRSRQSLGLKEIMDPIGEYRLKRSSPILVCDMREGELKEAELYTLEERKYRAYRLPLGSGNHHDIYQDNSFLTSIDLGKRSWLTRARRWFSPFPCIFLINIPSNVDASGENVKT